MIKKYLLLIALLCSSIYYTNAQSCSGLQTLTATTGTFNDGSLPNFSYNNNSNCSWLIQPVGVTGITLTFTRFSTEQGFDSVSVYDGNSNSATLLGTYSGSIIPTPITSSGGSLFIEFMSDASVNRTGWEANYTSNLGCAGLQTLTATSGTFSDGTASNSNYNDNSNCSWLIQPVGAGGVTLTFTRFITEATLDRVRVYDGNSNAAPILGSYSGSSIPPSITSSGNSLFVEFMSDASLSFTGWEANYTGFNTCVGQQTLTNNSGTFNDGTPASVSYLNNTNCSWLIQPPGATGIVMSFSRFDIEFRNDRVRIYDGASNSAPLLRDFSGMMNIPLAINSSGGSMYVEFITNGSNVSTGWEANYATIITNLEEIDELKPSIDILPNPNNGNFNIETKGLDKNKQTMVSIRNVVGKVVYRKELPLVDNRPIYVELEASSGVYFVLIEQERKTFNQKIVIQ